MFEEWIGDVPGKSSTVFALYDQVKSAAESLDDSIISLRDAQADVPTWTGESFEAFTDVSVKQRSDMSALQAGLEQGGSALNAYAWSLESYQAKATDLRAQARLLDKKFDAAAPSEKAEVFLTLFFRARDIWTDYSRCVSNVKADAEVCAASLYEALHIEALNYNKEYLNRGARTPITEGMRWDIETDLRILDYKNVHQGQIGDCYFLATMMAMMRTSEGRTWIRNQIRWDERSAGYLVTVYDDPLHPREGEKRVVLVQDIYVYGARGDKDSASVAGVFEAAYGQIHPGGTRGTNGIAGGWLRVAWEDLTRRNDATVVKRDWSVFGFGGGYSDFDRARIIQSLDDGRAVAAETVTGPGKYYDDDGWAFADNLCGDGETIRIVKDHEYMVVAADKSGVTLVNPWGKNYTKDWVLVDGEFTISWDDFGRYSGSVEMGGPY